jgi:hypothetical protein
MLVKPEFREQARLGLRTEETRHIADVARHHSLQVASEMTLAADPGARSRPVYRATKKKKETSTGAELP